MTAFEPFLAWRFLLRTTDRGRFSPLTAFAWLAIGVGVGAMGSLLSVMYGFEASLRDRVLKAYPHLIVRPKSGGYLQEEDWRSRFQAIRGVVRAIPYLESELVARSSSRSLGVVVRGLEPGDLDVLKPDLIEGRLPDPKSPIPEVVLASELAARLGVGIGATLRLVSPLKRSGALGLTPQSSAFEVVGLYTSGHYEFDQQYLFMELSELRRFMKVGPVLSAWGIWSTTAEAGLSLAIPVQAVAASWETQTWAEFNSALFFSLKLEQLAMSLIFSFAIAIAVMNIVITLMMHVNHKRKHIGVLRALGASKRQIARIFLWEGGYLGGIGLAFGAGLMAAFFVYLRWFSKYQLPDIYYDRSLPIEIRPLALIGVYGAAAVAIAIGVLYPAKRAARLDPIEAIRE